MICWIEADTPLLLSSLACGPDAALVDYFRPILHPDNLTRFPLRANDLHRINQGQISAENMGRSRGQRVEWGGVVLDRVRTQGWQRRGRACEGGVPGQSRVSKRCIILPPCVLTFSIARPD